VIVDRALYVGGRRAKDGASPSDDLARARAEPSGFVWIGLYEPSDEEFAEVREAFGLHPLAVEDAINAHQRPKVERYGDSLFVVLKTASYIDADESVDVGEIMLFIGDGFIVTVRHGEYAPLSGVRRQLEEDAAQLLEHGPVAVLYAVADRVVDGYAAVLAGLDNDIEEIEEQVFTADRANHAERIYRLKREVVGFRRAVTPLPEALEDLRRARFGAEHDLHAYFRDVHDHAVRANDHLLSLDELLNGALNANLAQITVRQNEDMRRISAWVAIAAVPTALAGIYGMNFRNMPELDARYGYFVVLLVMLTICVTLYRLFKRSGWL
jgi:magnesium transporter